jgi:hypothetical protein
MRHDNKDIMRAFFSGKLKNDIEDASKSKIVELGNSIGIGHKDGTYSQYIKQLEEQITKGNGVIYLGKSVKTDKNTLSIQDPTDNFSTKDVPKLILMFNTILNPIQIQVLWKDSKDSKILDQHYSIPSAHSNNYDWWDSFSVLFIGPENLERGSYKIDITSKDTTKVLSTSIEFSVTDQ